MLTTKPMTHTSSILTFLSALLLLTCAYLFIVSHQNAKASVGADGYQATSTAANALFGSQTVQTRIRTGPGIFGSVIITGANTGVVNIYDATTTDVNKRTGNTATSTILLASLPGSLVAGTYTFDVSFGTGLLVDVWSGSMPTSTITWK